jgi:deoxyribonuclease-2
MLQVAICCVFVLAVDGFGVRFENTTSGASADPTCIDRDGNKIDWWFIYKQPNGFEYSYKQSGDTTTSPLVVASGAHLDNNLRNALGATLHQVYLDKVNLAYVLYNDEDPITGRTTGGGTGHTKGAIVAGPGGSGYWLVHSVPKFPDLRGKDFTWAASDTYGQSMLCVTLDSKGIETAAKQEQYTVPHVYDKNLPSSLASKLPSLFDMANGKTLSGAGTSVGAITTTGGTKLQHFAKTPSWGEDFYEMLVAPGLATSLYVETWRRAPWSATFCTKNTTSKYNIMNIEDMSFDAAHSFKYTKDHSKIAVSASSSKPYVCVGGVNRMPSQRKRGGGALCFQSLPLWSALSAVVSRKDSCSGPAPGPGPSPSPSPSPPPPGPSPTSGCCFSSAASCTHGDVCCKSGCTGEPKQCTYTQAGCSGTYGKKHNCTWVSDECVVG